MSEKASEAQIATIVEKLLKSPIPASFQDEVLNSLHVLTSCQATALLANLSELALREETYIQTTQNWHSTWTRISERVSMKLSAEAERIESWLDAKLRGR